MTALRFAETQLQDLWQDAHPHEAAPPELARLKNWRALVDSRMVGHCTGDQISGEIIGLSVDHACRRQGIGSELLFLVVAALRAAGAPRIWVAAPPDPALPAYSFYRALGWVPTGEQSSDGSEILELRAHARRCTKL